MGIKKLSKWGLLAVSAAFAVPSFAAQVESPFEVGTWGNFAKGAISHTFDDNTTGQIKSAMPAFDEKGFKMTFFVVTSWFSDWSPYKEAFKNGHEIASHTVSHNSSDNEFQNSKNTIKQNVPGEMCVTVAYPNCNQNSANTLNYYIAGRNCDGQINSKTPSNFAQISSKLAGSGQTSGLSSADQFNSFADQAASSNGWAVPLHHGVGSGDHSYATTDPTALKTHLDYLDKNRDKIWCETFGNVARYIKERDAVTLSKVSSTDNSITISVTDNLPDSIFNYPLSIRFPKPSEWSSTEPVVVKQKDEVIESSIVGDNIVFNAVPDAGDIVISSNLVGTLKHYSKNAAGFSPVILKNSVLTVDPQYFNGSELSVTFFNLTGKKLGVCKIGRNETSAAIPADKITKSAFIAKVSGGNRTVVQKFIPQM